MKRICNPALLLTTALLFAGTIAGYAQKDTLKQEVEVVKAYIPGAIDAEKINDMPSIKDTEHKKPDFSYSISSSPVFSALSVKTLQAATVIGQPADEPGFGLIRAGAGNYNKPYAELFFNSKNNKNSVFGIHARHLSSHAKLTLQDKDRVNAPFSENEAEMFMKYLFRKSILSVNLGVDHNGFRYYGYPGPGHIPTFLTDENQEYTLQGHRQSFTRGGIHINLDNLSASKDDPSSGFDFRYTRFGAKTGQREDYVDFNMNFIAPRDGFKLFADAGIEYSGTNKVYYNLPELSPLTTNHRNQLWLKFKPAVEIGNETINLKAGIRSWFVWGNLATNKFKITPDIRFEFTPVREIINLFAGVDGNYHHNHYAAVALDNPFILPTVSVNNHFEKFRFFGGFDGKLSVKTNFKIEIDHSTFEQHPFYYLQGFRLPTMGPLPGPAYTDNAFRVLYDDMKTLRFNGEITHHAGDKLSFLLSTNIYKYTVSEQEMAWNLPRFDATLAVSYAITERLNVEADIYVTGKRKGLIVQLETGQNPNIAYEQIGSIFPGQASNVVMDNAIDLNLNGKYEITRKLSAFVQLNNFGFRKYEKWMGYPVQSFNLLGGISYSF
jgi:hypothetical protein